MNVLIIEDDDDYAMLLINRLRSAQDTFTSISHANCVAKGLNQIARGGIDLILLDLSLPDSDGIMTFKSVYELAIHIPIIIISALSSETLALEAIQLGAKDFVVKGVSDGDMLIRTIKLSLERNKKDLETSRLAFTDVLTNLYNRRGFMAIATHQTLIAKRRSSGYSIFIMDLDNLKQINDECSHQIGDEAIQSFAEILKRCFRNSDIIGRVGGDEFAVMALETNAQSCQLLMQRLHQHIYRFNRSNTLNYELAFSIGVAEWQPNAIEDIVSVMDQADREMYENKRLNKRSLQNKGNTR